MINKSMKIRIKISDKTNSLSKMNNDSVNQFDMNSLRSFSWTIQWLLICIYSLTAAFSLVINLVTIIVLIKGQRCAKDIKKFQINLSIADIGIAFTYMFGQWSIKWSLMCPIIYFGQLCFIIVSAYTTIAIGSER